ncbi:MAG: DUF4389 domain-containing protein [Acidimicrobiales bacterium]|jgi:hypothetical protein
MAMASWGGLAEASTPVEVRVGTAQRQRRLTVLFRLILLIPQAIVLWFVAIGALVVIVLGWFAALFTGRLPESFARFILGYVRWSARVQAYGLLLTDKYPPFSLEADPTYPVDVMVVTGRLNRAAVLFRLILVIPAAIVADLLTYGIAVLGPVIWIIVLVAGRMPDALFGAGAAVVRYQARYIGYYAMLTSEYPGDVFGDRGPGGQRLEGTVSGTPDPQPPPPPTPVTWMPSPPPAWSGEAGSVVPTAPPQTAVPVPAATPPLPPLAPPPPSSDPTAAPPPPPLAPPPPPVPGWVPQGPPGSIAPPGGWASGPAPRLWPLVLTRAARVMTAVLMVLGAVASIAYVAAVPHLVGVTSLQSRVDSEVVSVDYSTLEGASQTFRTATQACQASPAASQLACLESADAAWAQALRTYGSAIELIGVPSAARSAATAAVEAANSAASTFESLASSPDAQSYSAAAVAPSISASLDAVDRTYDELVSTLNDN